MKVKKTIFCLVAGWAGLQTLVAVATTAAASAATDADGVIDTRINFMVRSAESGSKIDTRTPGGTMMMVR